MEDDWKQEFKDTYLTVGEGPHELTLYGPPERAVSKWKRDDGSDKIQWVFKSANLDGQIGDLAPSKTLGRLCRNAVMKNEKLALATGKTPRDAYPVKMKFTRTGMGSKDTKITVLE